MNRVRLGVFSSAALCVLAINACSSSGTDDDGGGTSSGTSGVANGTTSGVASNGGTGSTGGANGSTGGANGSTGGANGSTGGANGSSGVTNGSTGGNGNGSGSGNGNGSGSGSGSSGASGANGSSGATGGSSGSQSGSSSGSSGTNPCTINGQIVCGGDCVNPLTDVDWCGATGDCAGTNAGTQCLGGKSCINGQCDEPCPNGWVKCGLTCINPDTSLQFCGAVGDCQGANAGTSCTAPDMCVDGVCSTSCTGVQCGGGSALAAALTVGAPTATGTSATGMSGTGTFTKEPDGPVTLSLTLSWTQVAFNSKTMRLALYNPTTPGSECNSPAAIGTLAIDLGTVTTGIGGLVVNKTFPNLTMDNAAATGIGGKSLVLVNSPTNAGATGAARIACEFIATNAIAQSVIPPVCIDPSTDPLFCGAVGNCQGVNAGEVCAAGTTCVEGACAAECPNAGEIKCGNTCIDPNANNVYCGATAGCGMGGNGSPGVTCPSNQECNNGTCQALCPPGLISCGANGSCVDPRTDNTYCGAYGACTANTAQDGTACSAGTQCNGDGFCTRHCLPGLLLKGGKCIDPETDNQFCGATRSTSGTVCANGSACSDGTCRANACASGYQLMDGRCYDPQVSSYYCGTGGVPCDLGEECDTGVCQPSTVTFLGAALPFPGRWRFPGQALGFPGGVAYCQSEFGSSTAGNLLYAGPCTGADLAVAEARGDLDDVVDTNGAVPTSFWAHDKTLGGSIAANGSPTTGMSSMANQDTAKDRVCHSTVTDPNNQAQGNPNNVAWTYATFDQTWNGQWVTYTPATGEVSDLRNETTAGESGTPCATTRTVACCVYTVPQ